MRHAAFGALATLVLAACGGAPATPPQEPESPSEEAAGEASSAAPEAPEATSGAEQAQGAAPAGAPGGEGALEFQLQDSHTAKETRGAMPSKLKPTASEALLKFVVVDKDKGPMQGVVVALASPDGKKFYTEETDSTGYCEVLVPVGQNYDLTYLSLGRKDIAAKVPVSKDPNQTVKLTLRYKRFNQPEQAEPRFVLDGIQFDTGKATIRPESLPRFESVVEFLTHKKSARIEISGHTDNVGNPKQNKALSTKRAQACRDYLVSKGIDAGRIEAVGYGDERPIAPNDSEDGRQQNRRIEAREL